MKKYLILFWLIFISSFQFVNADQLTDHIKTNFEYIESEEEMISYTKYTTNKWNIYYMFGWYSFYKVADMNELNNMKKYKYIKNDTVFIIYDKEIRSLISEKFSFEICKKLDSKSYKLLNNYSNILKHKRNDITFIWDAWEDFECYQYDNYILFSDSSYSREDLSYLFRNYKKIISKIDKIKDKWKYKELYWYVMKNTSYNFSALKDLWKYSSPFLVSSFFEWKDVVCDGYSRTYSLLSSFKWWNSSRVVGDVQPIENSKFDVWDAGHSWVKIWNLYYDPTFDDSPQNYSYNYFAKSKTCFNLDHYSDWWILFENKNIRTKYIKQNIDELIDDCSFILGQSIIKDDSVIDMLKYILVNLELEKSKKFMCEIFDICLNDIKTKDKFIDKLNRYNLFYNEKKIYLQKELSWLDLNKKEKVNYNFDKYIYRENWSPDKNENIKTEDEKLDREIDKNQLDEDLLTSKEKDKLKKLVSLLNKKINKYPLSKRTLVKQALKEKLIKKLKTKVSKKKKLMLKYVYINL